ncbi:MAG: S8 family serine peptidase, partial [Alkalispirochaeta sp.]
VIRGVLVAAGADGTQRTAPARVINMSLGADVEALDDPSILLFESAVEEAQRRGLLLVAASGNGKIPDGVDNAQAPQGQSDGIDWPARFPGVIAVGSVDRSADPENSPRSYFSDYGLQLELMAPGAESSGPDADDTTGIVSTVPIEGSVDGAYATQAGTSMAAPLVAGAAALVWSANPHLSADQIRRILQQTALDLGDPGRDEEFGYGLLDVGAALQRASTTPYGRYGSSTESGAAVALEDEITARQLIRSKQNTRYQQSQPVDFIVYVGEDIDHETFHRRVVEVVPEARVESLGFLPLGSAIRVSVDASSAASVEGGVDGPALFRFLQDDPAVLSVTQNRTIQFYRP